MNEILKKLKKIKEKIKKMFCRKKYIKIIDLTTGKDVSKHVEISFTGISTPKDDDTLGSFTKDSGIAP